MNIIVNGATRGIGRETALLLAGKGNSVLVTGRNEKSLNELASVSVPGRLIPCRLDISRFDKHEKAFTDIIASSFESVDILINSAACLVTKDFSDFTAEEARKMMETNFIGVASVLRSLIPFMKKGSHIVNISSMGGFQGSVKYRGLSYYSASKAALSCLTECLALEFIEKGIAVNCLALGSVQTEMFEEAFPGLRAPVSVQEMGKFVADFSTGGGSLFNGKIIPVAFSNP
ncbi:MAG: SDR family oxidoreductase [Bacteroidales bacterium]|nr:SDR family oxidoreductase [Bacteroidales bacterium]